MSTTNVGSIEWTVDANTRPATNSIGAMGAQVTRTENQLNGLETQVATTTRSVRRGMAGMSRGAGQAGIQVQQFIGQVQGGQGIMLAFSQQAADIGIVLGAPMVGAILGISASIVGMLLPSLMSGKTGLELLEKATENVKAAMTLGSTGVIEYAAEMKKLKVISENLTEIKLANLIAEQKEAFKVGLKGISDLVDDAGTDFVSGQLFDMKTISKEGRKAFKEVNDSSKELKLEPTAENIEKVEAALLRLSRAGVDSKKAGRELTSQLGGLIAEYKLGKLSIEALQKALKNTDEITSTSSKTTKKYTAVVRELEHALAIASREVVGMTKEAKELNAEFQAENMLGGDATKEQIASVVALLGEVSSAQDEVSKKKQGVALAESVASRGQSPTERLQEEHAQLLELKAKFVDDSAVYDAALTANANEQADLRSAYNIANANLIMSSSADLFGNLAGLLKDSGKEQSSAYKAMFALSKGFAVAQAAMNLGLAISNASAVTPWYASIPAMASVVANGASLASSIAGATYSGREHGGSVIGGQTYEVGEKNKPEMLMIPGNNGKVFSNAEMKSAMGGGGNGGNVSVNLYNAPAGTRVESHQDTVTGEMVIDMIVEQMGGPNSPGRRALSANSNITGVLNGKRRS